MRCHRSSYTHRRAEAGGRKVLHDPGGAFGTKNALIYGVVLVALDIGDLAFFHVDIDAASTRAHVAGRLADFVRDLGRCVELWLRHDFSLW